MLTRKVHRINDTRKSDLNEIIIYVLDVKRGPAHHDTQSIILLQAQLC